MSNVPFNRYSQAKALCSPPEKRPIEVVGPVPARQNLLPGLVTHVQRGLVIDDAREVDREAEIMRTLEWPRFS